MFYLIRHKATGQFMPQMKRGRGYTHWNPGNPEAQEIFGKLNIPRLVETLKKAKAIISCWNAMPNSKTDMDGDLVLGRIDNRKKEDLEIVIVNLTESGVITS